MRITTTAVAALALSALVLGDLGEAAASVLCKTRGGGVVLRQTCKRKETPLDLTQLGGVCPKGEPGSPGSGTRIVDANGRSVGPILSSNSVMLTIGTQPVAVRVDTAGFVEGGEFLHTSADCSGQRYLRVFDVLLPFGVIVGSTLHYPEFPMQSLQIRSSDSPAEPAACTSGGGTVLPGGRCCGSSSPSTMEVGPAKTFDLGALGLVPPFQAQVIP